MNSDNKNSESGKVGRIDPVDMIIARRLYIKRLRAGYSQKNLADCTGVSIQQIQKYEKSTNRISCGRLYRFAKLLDVSINYFFDNMEEELLKGKPNGSASYNFAEEQEAFVGDNSSKATEREVITLVKFYNGIADYSVRKKFVDLIRAISSSTANCS